MQIPSNLSLRNIVFKNFNDFLTFVDKFDAQNSLLIPTFLDCVAAVNANMDAY